MNLLDRLFNRDCNDGTEWSSLKRTLTLHDEMDWTNVFTFKRVDGQTIIRATDGVDTHEVSLDAEQFAQHLGNGLDLAGNTVTSLPVTSHFEGDYFHLDIGGITGQWHADKSRCIKLWKVCVEPFNI